MIVFNKKYFLAALVLFLIEVFIASFVHDRIVRPYIGDLLVVIFIYCFCTSFVDAPVSAMALSVLLFAYVVELLQYLNFIHYIGLHQSKLANIILGNSFQWIDMIAYTIGILLVFCFEFLKQNKLPSTRLP
ncbi:MAG: DUF2809 domain-containing protein [Flavisolibacter sp.]